MVTVQSLGQPPGQTRASALWRMVAAVLLIGAGLIADARPAAAHTALLETIPANRSTWTEPPETLTIVFAEAVDPRSVTIELLKVDGTPVPGIERTTPASPESATIEFSLPDLEPGVYGMPWQTVGPDGHRVSGEVVIGVGGSVDSGALASASFSSTEPIDRFFDWANAAGRLLWYVGLSLAIGGLVGLWLQSRVEGDSAAHERITAAAQRAMVLGALVTFAGVALRWVTTVAVLARSYNPDLTSMDDIVEALGTRTGLFGLAALGLSAVLVLQTRRDTGPITDVALIGARAAALFGVIAAGVATGHTVTLSETPFEIWVAAVHVAAAGVWLGPLLVAVIAVRSGWNELVTSDRAVALRAYFADYTTWAAVAFVALVVTGVRSLWLNLGDAWFRGTYGGALAVKLILVVAVIVPLGFYHDRAVKFRARSAASPVAPAAKGVGSGSFVRTLRVEAGAMLVVLLLATVLTGVTPSVLDGIAVSEGGGSGVAAVEGLEGADLLDDTAVEDIAECAELGVGQANCYRTFFRELMKSEGASVAVARVEELQATDSFIQADCHQVVHDLGNDALEYYGDLGTALTYEGSACWSGYYHGVIEFALRSYTDEQLQGELPDICDKPAEDAGLYSFTHYNCVHGVGHGVMLRLEADLFTSLDYCSAYTDAWEETSCVGGAFMENIVSEQQGDFEAALKDDDLLYPCLDVGDEYADDCFTMQTSYILWKNGYDYAGAFGLCNSLESDLKGTCYGSMGRDISGNHLLDVEKVMELCGLGDDDHRYRCFEGAALNALYNDAATVNAFAVCDRLEATERDTCTDTVANAALYL